MTQKVLHEKLMGTAFSLGVVAKSEAEANHWLQKGIQEIREIEILLTEYQSTSITSQINHTPPHVPLEIPFEVFDLLQRCIDISILTDGTFDVTTNVLKKLYPFKNQDFSYPTKELLDETLQSVGFQKIKLDHHHTTITKLAPNMNLSFNAIGKGYAADKVKKIWQSNGISSGFINASGDLCAFGTKKDGTPWMVAIANPDQKNKPLLYLPVFNQAVATSGDYEQYFIHEGRRYSHNINPKTGKPLDGIKSVSVISPSAELSDALATAVYVMGEKMGLAFTDQLPQSHCIIINEENKISFSNKLNYEEISV